MAALSKSGHLLFKYDMSRGQHKYPILMKIYRQAGYSVRIVCTAMGNTSVFPTGIMDNFCRLSLDGISADFVISNPC
jgi:hypothetical protein